MTDADTIANAELLWKLVQLVQEAVTKSGTVRNHDQDRLTELRALADELDPDNSNWS